MTLLGVPTGAVRPNPQPHVEAGEAGFGDGRQVRQGGVAFQGGRCESAQRSVLGRDG
jgi:hypothetical protein